MAGEMRIGVEDILEQFAELEDPRSEINRRHPLESVIAISVMAVLAGANGPTAIAQWAKLKADLLVTVLPLPHGIPGKDVFRRVLATLKPDAFQVVPSHNFLCGVAPKLFGAGVPGDHVTIRVEQVNSVLFNILDPQPEQVAIRCHGSNTLLLRFELGEAFVERIDLPKQL